MLAGDASSPLIPETRRHTSSAANGAPDFASEACRLPARSYVFYSERNEIWACASTGEAMEHGAVTSCLEEIKTEYNGRFLEFIKRLVLIDKSEKLFPKQCRTCGTSFLSLSEYLSATVPKGHSWQDCEEVMGKPFTMMYRHCTCGNTLVLTLTEKTFPTLRDLWSMLRDEAEKSGRPLDEVVGEFSEQCDNYMFSQVYTGDAKPSCEHSQQVELDK